MAVAEGLPVMVYLHGGGYVAGAAHQYQPHVLLDHQVVIVVPQFRLGTLGKEVPRIVFFPNYKVLMITDFKKKISLAMLITSSIGDD